MLDDSPGFRLSKSFFPNASGPHAFARRSTVRLNLGLGPVFKFECLSTSRRWQHFAARVFFIGSMLLVLALVVWNVEAHRVGPVGLREMAKAGEAFYCAIVGTQLALLVLVAPAVAADAICLDKARGALLPLLTTDLSSREIILGKFCARFLPILGFVFCGLPVLAICLSLGGIHPEAVFGATLVSLGVALIGGTGALALSVFCTKTYEVLLVCYLVWSFFLLSFLLSSLLGIPTGWTKYANPFFLCFAPYTNPGIIVFDDVLNFLIGCAGLAAFFILVAIAGLRRVVLRHGSVRAKSPRRRLRWNRVWFPGPSLDGNPVLWREWHRRQPSRWVRTVWWLYVLGALGFSIFGFTECILIGTPGFSSGLEVAINAIQVGVGLLLVSVISVTSFQEERVRGGLDVLLTTPLSTIEIYWGKWWGNFRIVLLLTILPTFVASGHYIRRSIELGWFATLIDSQTRSFLLMPLVVACFGAAVVSFGLALAIWYKNQARAVIISVATYVLVTGGLFWVARVQIGRPEQYAAIGSSSLAAAFLTEVCRDHRYRFVGWVIPTLMIWCIGYALVAAVFSVLTCRSFDRCMGRVPDRLVGRRGKERAVELFHGQAMAGTGQTLSGD
jgi:ABC-type transport system involved in multi-copper enzyme maturation permease subunit